MREWRGRRMRWSGPTYTKTLSAQDAQHFFQLDANLAHDLLRLRQVVARLVALQAIAGAADREALFVQQAADLADDEHVLALVIAAIAAALDGLELRELLLPIAQDVWLHPAKVADFTDGEVALAGDRGQFAVIACFQHTPRLELSVFVPVETSRHGGR